MRALVRKTSDPAKVDRLKQMGAEIVEGDLTDKDSLITACQGVDTIITTVTTTSSQTPGDSIPSVDQMGQLQLVDAAAETNVSRFIYISLSGNIEIDCPLTTAKRSVEQRIMDSNMTYTILRPSYFMEVWLSPAIGFDYPNYKATLYGDGKNPISWISFVDVARFAVKAVESPAAQNAILELGGPDKLSPNDVVKIFEDIMGQDFQVDYVPVSALAAQKAGAANPLQQSFSSLMLQYAEGDPIDMANTLKSFPVNLSSVRDFATRVAAPTSS